MNQTHHSSPTARAFNPARQLISALLEYRALLLIPMIAGTFLAGAYAVLWPKSYSARQSLAVRDDLLGQSFKPGRFDSLESMKSAQETILEIARRPKVIRATMQSLASGQTPSDEIIEETQGKISFSAPNGAEFGKTEVIVLNVKASSRQKANAFIEALLSQVDEELKLFRSNRFKSMTDELGEKAKIAKHFYDDAAKKLSSIEQTVGADLSTLRSLSDSQNGSNGLQTSLADLKTERRAQRKRIKSVEANIKTLERAQLDTDNLATSYELSEWHPAIAQLKQALVQTKLKLSNHLSRYSSDHPLVIMGHEEIADIEERIKSELTIAISTLKNQHKEYALLSQDMDSQVAELENRLGTLSGMRVKYESLSQDAIKKQNVYSAIQESQAEIQALAAASNVSLLTRVDTAQVGAYPLGPSKKMIVLGGMFGGLFFGLGLVVFFAPIDITDQPIATLPPRRSDNDPNESTPHRPKSQPKNVSRTDSLQEINSAIDSIAKSTLPPNPIVTLEESDDLSELKKSLQETDKPVSPVRLTEHSLGKPIESDDIVLSYRSESGPALPIKDLEPTENQSTVRPVELASIKKQLESKQLENEQHENEQHENEQHENEPPENEQLDRQSSEPSAVKPEQHNQVNDINSQIEKLSQSISTFCQHLPPSNDMDQTSLS